MPTYRLAFSRFAHYGLRAPLRPRIYQPSFLTKIPEFQRFTSTVTTSKEQQWDDLLAFWFNRNPQHWYTPPEGLDDEIRSRYGDLVEQARTGTLDHWQSDPRGVLSLVLLLDQFPRNIFRGSAKSFSSDIKAQKMVIRAIGQGFDAQLGKTSKFQQCVVYMPLMHAEDLLSQIACVALLDHLTKSCPEGSAEREFISQSTAFSQRHLQCVMQLGRFPKRNEALGRTSTDKEHQYLKEKPIGF